MPTEMSVTFIVRYAARDRPSIAVEDTVMLDFAGGEWIVTSPDWPDQVGRGQWQTGAVLEYLKARFTPEES